MSGRLAVEYYDKHWGEGLTIEAYIERQLEHLIHSSCKPADKPIDVVLYGFGRIGRLVTRIMIAKADAGASLRLRAIVVRKGGAPNDIIKRASLLRRDSVHGSFQGTIRVDEDNGSFVANGNEIKVIYANAPEEVDYTAYGISDCIVVDNTGAWRDQAGLSRHLEAKGVKKVILTAPGKEGLKNIVAGINHGDIGADDQLISAASCTTNAIAPPLKALDGEYGHYFWAC